METLCRACKREFDSEFGGGRAGTCTHCGTHVLSNLSRHIIDYHLELGRLWRCPVEWCSVWKGTTQDCVDHLRVRHNVDTLVARKMLGKYFPPWTVTRETWHAVLYLGISDIATDIMLFHQHGRRLVHRYRIYRDPLPHVSLRGMVIRKLTAFANRVTVARLTNLHLETRAVCHTLSSFVPIAAVNSPVEPDLTGSSTLLATAVPDVCSSAMV